ncbi:MAG: hypothetical protein ACI857_003031 [Arenicella sp.]|jgi:hypothetical protein
MKFTISKKPSIDELKASISQKFPDYELKMMGKKQLIVKKSSTCSVTVMVRSSSVLVAGNFPSMGGRLLFTFSMLLLGILIPLIVYFATFHKKFKAMEKEVGGFLEGEFGSK